MINVDNVRRGVFPVLKLEAIAHAGLHSGDNFALVSVRSSYPLTESHSHPRPNVNEIFRGAGTAGELGRVSNTFCTFP
jgi:hypothetical protein